MQKLTLTRPDDWHLHLRDGDALKAVLPHSARQFARAIVMPNLKPPVRTVADAADYRNRILAALPVGQTFEPLMTLYLTDNTSPEEISAAKASKFVKAVKYYPAGATTNSDFGVTDIRKCDRIFAAMEQEDIPLLLHGEVTDTNIDVFDREKVFIETHLIPLVSRFPKLRVVLEHITTSEAVTFVLNTNENIGATITPQHLLFSRNAIFKGGIRPHYYCLPILKREKHRQALLQAATSGNPKFFLGTDSAPHARNSKEQSCGCAGCYSALHAMELYAEAFESANALDKLEAFASFYGPDFYQLPRNTKTITLAKQTWQIPDEVPFPGTGLVPLRAGEEITWKIMDG
ncbi:dihydroorotase [Acaryochloris marina]|uniref:Dihydroorotase n=1 Tax=Acaryochloris marina (strain MBIC 11017) TaxID=329726 RepID=PYRC_ACAM1|nr:dihydroorotase [Acaryochloris marina]B0CF78.1 RecName: Full=Dihydroorotase; Short=DHOase [Acaryochloris marina MBIC11017]ABW30594.1 dihydroorotase, homodimeric type [Acaryochloris marina MBIC11017]